MSSQPSSLKKLQQISQQNKIMFLWIAGASVVVGISLVLTLFLVQKIAYKDKVLAEMDKTSSQLDKNIKNIKGLRENISKLNSNEALASTKLEETDKAIQSILDAMPAKGNPAALASSLEKNLLLGIPGITIEAIGVQAESSDTAAASSTSNSATTVVADQTGEISFTFTVKTDSMNNKPLQDVLEKIEKSIRPINITNITISSQDDKLTMTVDGVSYYKIAQKVELIDKVVKP